MKISWTTQSFTESIPNWYVAVWHCHPLNLSEQSFNSAARRTSDSEAFRNIDLKYLHLNISQIIEMLFWNKKSWYIFEQFFLNMQQKITRLHKTQIRIINLKQTDTQFLILEDIYNTQSSKDLWFSILDNSIIKTWRPWTST